MRVAGSVRAVASAGSLASRGIARNLSFGGRRCLSVATVRGLRSDVGDHRCLQAGRHYPVLMRIEPHQQPGADNRPVSIGARWPEPLKSRLAGLPTLQRAQAYPGVLLPQRPTLSGRSQSRAIWRSATPTAVVEERSATKRPLVQGSSQPAASASC